MDDSDLVAFDPVAVRPRRDGWTPQRQYYFILLLARGYTPARAAAVLGMTRKSAYELRSKPGGDAFAAAWAAAAARAKGRRRAARAPGLAGRTRGGEWHPRLHQGRLIGWERRPADARSPGPPERPDRQAEPDPPGTDAAHYERFLALMCPAGGKAGAD